MMHYHHAGWGAGAWIAMAFVMVVFWGAVVTAIVFAVRATTDRPALGQAAPPATNALSILDERFARGEINADEYRQRRDLLQGK